MNRRQRMLDERLQRYGERMCDIGGTYSTRGGPIYYTRGCYLIGEDLSPRRSFNGDPDGPLGMPPILRRVRHRRTGNGVEVVSSGRREHASGDGRDVTANRDGWCTTGIRWPNAVFRRRATKQRTRRSRTTTVCRRDGGKRSIVRYGDTHRLSVALVLSETGSAARTNGVRRTVYRPTHVPWKKKRTEI